MWRVRYAVITGGPPSVELDIRKNIRPPPPCQKNNPNALETLVQTLFADIGVIGLYYRVILGLYRDSGK